MSKYTEAIKIIYEVDDYISNCFGGYPYTDEEQEMLDSLELAIEALEKADRLEYAYHNAFGIDLAKCTKYGNESAEQQRDSYSTVVMYEVANVFGDILGE